jgi:hypothetical protein
MKGTIKITLSTFAIIGFMGLARAADSKSEDHSAHHPEGQAAEAKKDENTGMGMMGKMDMNQMMGMMHECMKTHKDGKMCDHSMMERCQKQMAEGECQKMMTDTKAESKKVRK